MQPIPPPAHAPALTRSPGNPAQLGGILLLVCAALVLIATFSRGWLTASNDRGHMGIGLIGFEACRGDRCEGEFFSDKLSKGSDADITVERYVAFLGGIASVVLLSLGGAMALTRKPDKVPLLATYIVCGVTLLFGVIYVGRVLSEAHGSRGPGPGWSFFLAILGLVGGALIAGLMIRPAAARMRGVSQLGAAPGGYAPQGYAPQQGYAPPQQGAQAAQAAPTCPRCGPQGQVTYAAQYQRYFCGNCQQYV